MSAVPRILPRTISPGALVIGATILAVATFGWSAFRPGSPPTPPARVTGSSGAPQVSVPDGVPAGVDPAIPRLDHAIATWTANVRDDSADFVSATNLAYDDYSRGRLTGDIEDYGRAQEAIRLALAAYPKDTAAQALDAVVRATLHDFGGALDEAQTIYGSDATQLQALATAGDAALELGRYAQAQESYATLERLAPGAAVTARLAHEAQIGGRLDDPATLASSAVSEAIAEGATGPGLSWYRALAGSIAFQAGRLPDAVGAFEAALRDWPGSYIADAGLGRALAAEGRYSEAITALRRAIAIVPQPDSLAALGDLYAVTGQAALARQQYATVRFIATIGALQRQVYDRSLALFDADHGTDVGEAVRLAQAEIAVRKDVYGWDTLAWALLAAGRPAEAQVAMVHALAIGTQDPMLDYHAGMIAAALGDTTMARRMLTEALRVDPGFQPLQAERARTTLRSLAGSGATGTRPVIVDRRRVGAE